MKLLQVNYHRELGQDNHDQMEYLIAAAERISHAPGVQWKIWAYDEDAKTAASVYLFDSDKQARAFGAAIPDSLGKLPGVSDIECRYFDVDARLSAITRGPVFARQEV